MKFKTLIFFICLSSNAQEISQPSTESTDLVQPQKVDYKMYVISIPKCGTWMLKKCINLITNRVSIIPNLISLNILTHNHDETSALLLQPSEDVLNKCIQLLPTNHYYLMGHTVYAKNYETIFTLNNTKTIFIIRDPRDRLISYIYHVYKYPESYPTLQNLNIHDLITHCIKNGIFDDFNQFLPWMNSKICYTCKFENLVGPKGGGDSLKQINEIQNIAKHINVELTEEQIQHACENLFGGTETFREGQIGSWKKYFTQEHKNTFKEVSGQMLIDLGYESSFDW